MGAGLPLDRLGPYLVEHAPEIGRIVRAEKFAGGESNPTFRLDTDRGRFVLRRKPPGKLLKSAHAVDREFRVMRALGPTSVPVPRAIHLCEDESVIGSAFYVMEHVAGRVFWDPAMPECGAEERARVYDAMNAALAALHGIDPASVGLSDFGRPGNYFRRQTERWTAQYRAGETEAVPEMDALIPWLAANLPEDDGRVAIVHGDWRIDNMIFAHDAPRLLAVLDWELSTLGHPLADLAYQCMAWRLPHEGVFRGLGGLDRAALGIPDEAAYLAAYARRTGMEPGPDWSFALVFSFFRMAAILAGVHRRALDGNASNPERARLLGASVPMLARMALELAEGRG